MQHIIVLIDSRLVSESCGAAILTCLNMSGVRYEVGDQIQSYIISFSREQAVVKESEAKKVSRMFISYSRVNFFQSHLRVENFMSQCRVLNHKFLCCVMKFMLAAFVSVGDTV